MVLNESFVVSSPTISWAQQTIHDEPLGDWYLLVTELNRPQFQLATIDFLRLLARFDFQGPRKNFIRAVISHKVLPATQDSFQVLQALTITLERYTTGANPEQISILKSGSVAVDTWLNEYLKGKRHRSRFRSWGKTALDELVRLRKSLVERSRVELNEKEQMKHSNVSAAIQDFFISYTSPDLDWARWIAWTLEEAGYSVVLQDWDFRPGENFVLRMDEAAKRTRSTIAVLSNDYLTAAYPQSEWAAAFSKDPKSGKKRLIPIKVRDCKPEGLLGQIIYINLVDLSEQDARMALLGGLADRGKPALAPEFPAKKVSYPGASQQSDRMLAKQSSSEAFVATPVSAGVQVPKNLSSQERLHLNQTLNAIPSETFNTLVFTLNPPPGIIAPMPATQGQRSTQLLSWAEGPGGCTLNVVREVLEQILPLGAIVKE